MKKSIAFITQYYLPEMGAPQSRLSETAQGLKKRGWAVEIYTAMPNYPTGKIFDSHKGKIISSEKIQDIRVNRYWLFPSNSSKTLPRIVSMVSFTLSILLALPRLVVQRPKYILVESPPLTLACTAWFMSLFSGSKLITNVSDLWPLSAKELGAIKEGILYSLLESLEKFIYKVSDVCTGQSQEIIDYVARIAPEKTFLFRNGVDTSRFNQNSEPNSGEKLKIVYAGLLGVAQGVYDICTQVNFEKLGVEFHIYGSGNQEELIKEHIRSNPHGGIFFHGIIEREKIPSTLQSYECTIVPLIKNIYGAVPSKIYEAMAAGLPILFSGEGEGALLIEKYQVGWVNKPYDWETLERNIQNIRKNRLQLAEIRKNCFKAAKENFDRNILIDKLDEYLCSAIK